MESLASCSVIALYRPPGGPLLSEWERHIAHLVLSEPGWLHALGWQEERLIQYLGLLRAFHLPPAEMVNYVSWIFIFQSPAGAGLICSGFLGGKIRGAY
ncbi:MAG: hypothetical protein H7A55_13890 [Verrucomicrobiaceae bacterium]|nr:hypothetical protein [Verrucomicrobiaceae bacterium]